MNNSVIPFNGIYSNETTPYGLRWFYEILNGDKPESPTAIISHDCKRNHGVNGKTIVDKHGICVKCKKNALIMREFKKNFEKNKKYNRQKIDDIKYNSADYNNAYYKELESELWVS